MHVTIVHSLFIVIQYSVYISIRRNKSVIIHRYNFIYRKSKDCTNKLESCQHSNIEHTSSILKKMLLESLCTAGGNVKLVKMLRKNVWWFWNKLKIELSWFSSSTSEFIPPIIENRFPKTCLYTHLHSSIIHNNPKVEATQTSIYRWMNTYIHAKKGTNCLISRSQDILSNAHYGLN